MPEYGKRGVLLIKSVSKKHIYNVVKNYFNCGKIVVANRCTRCYNTYCISGHKKVLNIFL